ncbi:MAG: hypothetical protein AAFY33_05940 [Cyanobacteria bacterium J06643_4]
MSYESHCASKTQFFPVALEATLEEPISKESRGRIKCQGIYYRAEHYTVKSQPCLQVGERVLMVAIRENVALIIPS